MKPRTPWAFATLLLTACGSPTEQQPSPLPELHASEVGVVVGNTAGNPWLLDEVSDLGIGWVRLDVYWHAIERTRGTYDWWIREDVRRADSLGLRIYATLYGTPAWLDPDSMTLPTADELARFVEAAVRELPEVDVWGYWNEPNEPTYAHGTPERYTEGLAVMAPIVHGAGKLLAGPEVSGIPPGLGHGRIGAREYVAYVLERVQVDVTSIHHYGPASELESLVRSLPGTQPVWVTETAYGPEQTPSEQAEHLRRVFEAQSRTPRWKVTLPYHWYADGGFALRGRPAAGIIREVTR